MGRFDGHGSGVAGLIQSFVARLFAEVYGFDSEEFGGLAQLFFDAEELVVFGDAVGAAR